MTMKFPFQIIDLTHPVSPDSPGWDLDCGFNHSNFIDYEDCTSEIKFRVQQIHSPLGIGTHMDAPAHCIPGAASITDLDLHRNYLLTQCVLINVSHQTDEHYQITKQDILDFEARYVRLKKMRLCFFILAGRNIGLIPTNIATIWFFQALVSTQPNYCLKEILLALG